MYKRNTLMASLLVLSLTIVVIIFVMVKVIVVNCWGMMSPGPVVACSDICHILHRPTLVVVCLIVMLSHVFID